MVTGTGAYQELFQGLLAERVFVNGDDALVPVIRLTNDSIGAGGSSSSVSVTNFPSPQIVSGSVSVSNFPAMYQITGSLSTTPPALQGISGSVSVGNFPALQMVSGTVIITETTPVDASKKNPSLLLAYNGSYQLTQVDKAIGGITYRKTLTWTGSVCIAVSAWVQQ